MMFTDKKKIPRIVAALSVAFYLAAPSVTMAAQENDDIDALIAEQQRVLNQLNDRKKRENDDKLAKQIESLTKQIEILKESKDKDSDFDTKGAIESISGQLAALEKQFEVQNKRQTELMESIKKLGERTEEVQRSAAKSAKNTERTSLTAGATASTQYLVNPGPSRQLNYTQDAVNSQGNSTMVFAYAPNQLYKVYCRAGYLTDMSFKKGEKISFVGGGDTTAWAVNSTTVDGVPHLYVKPIVEASTTNLIVTTDKRSYQIILATSEWYNPMVTWTYENEEKVANLLKREKEEKTVVNAMNVKSYEELNFNYKITAKKTTFKPSMVFDDGEKTVIKFGTTPKKMPAVFVREKGRKGVKLVNFKVKDNCYILDCVIDKAELRLSEQEIVEISREKQ